MGARDSLNFCCQGCNRICDWGSRVPIGRSNSVAFKTVGNMYCDNATCVALEAIHCGVSIETIRELHEKERQAFLRR